MATHSFTRNQRLTHAKQYAAVYEGKCRKNRGSLMIYTLPNDVPHARLGLSVGSRIGNAVVRGRTKRLIREAFRLSQHEFPTSPAGTGYDLIVSVRGAPPTVLAGLGKALVELVIEADREWRRRAKP